ncbi:MAG: family 20 glycosylhydrolase, partial [Bacteroidales bacterium]|nr:family 20 glycosylhydrolase [Bacteroidales bacterium]
GSKRDYTTPNLTPQQWDSAYSTRKMYYSQDEIREVVKYAADRGIKIIPEIEVPGHASASIAAYPWLGSSSRKENKAVWGDLYNVTDPKVETFIHNVLDEVITLFPSKIVHIGGDEANYAHWQNSEEIGQFMKEKNIPTFSDLQLYANNRLSAYLASKGCRMIGWNEITGDNIRGEAHMQASQSEKLAPGTIVQFWDGEITLVNKAIAKGYDVVNSNRFFTYLDYPYDGISFEKAYSFNPIPEGIANKDQSKIYGFGCQAWGEFTPTTDRLYYQVFPRIAALAECGWTSYETKNFADFRERFKKIEVIWKEKGYLKTQLDKY